MLFLEKEAAPATGPVVEQMIDTTVDTETETVVEEISEPEEKTAGEEEAAKLQRLYEEGLALGERFCLQHEEEKM